MKMRHKDLPPKKILSAIPFFPAVALSVIFFATSAHASPPFCADIFQNGLQTTSSGEFINLGYNTQLKDGSTSQLHARTVQTSPWSVIKSCGEQHCTANGGHGQRLYGAPGKTTTANRTATVAPHTKQTLGETANEFRNITVQEWATGEFSDVHNEYIIDTLEMSYKSRLRLPAGNYWVKNLKLEVDGKIDVLGAGTVNLFVIDSLNLPLNFLINDSSKNAAKFGIYAYNDVNFYVSSKTYAFIHAERKVTLHYKSALAGGIIARDIELQTESQVRYDADAARGLSFGSMCVSM